MGTCLPVKRQRGMFRTLLEGVGGWQIGLLLLGVGESNTSKKFIYWLNNVLLMPFILFYFFHFL